MRTQEFEQIVADVCMFIDEIIKLLWDNAAIENSEKNLQPISAGLRERAAKLRLSSTAPSSYGPGNHFRERRRLTQYRLTFTDAFGSFNGHDRTYGPIVVTDTDKLASYLGITIANLKTRLSNAHRYGHPAKLKRGELVLEIEQGSQLADDDKPFPPDMPNWRLGRFSSGVDTGQALPNPMLKTGAIRANSKDRQPQQPIEKFGTRLNVAVEPPEHQHLDLTETKKRKPKRGHVMTDAEVEALSAPRLPHPESRAAKQLAKQQKRAQPHQAKPPGKPKPKPAKKK